MDRLSLRTRSAEDEDDERILLWVNEKGRGQGMVARGSWKQSKTSYEGSTKANISYVFPQQ